MLFFKDFIKTKIESIDEEFDMLEEGAEPKADSDTKGRLHELLTGYHLLGGKHMTKHSDVDGDSPKQAHDKLKEKVLAMENGKEIYKKIYNRAKSTAEDLKKHVSHGGHEVHDVHWTSKPGDIKRSTGVDASQKEDASDIIIHGRKKGDKQVKDLHHYGVSLKVSDSGSHNVPVSNPGIESSYGGQKILDKHREEIKAKYPKLNSMSVKERKEAMAANPKMDAHIRQKNRETLAKFGSHIHKTLTSMNSRDLVNHIKTHVLQCHETPLQKAGHTHIRHTTYEKGGEFNHHAVIPSHYYSKIFEPRNHQHISVEQGSTRSGEPGATLNFKFKGKTFASQRMKFNSQSDPFSSIKGSGAPLG